MQQGIKTKIKAKTKRRKTAPTLEQLQRKEQKSQIKSYRTFFKKINFAHHPSDGIEINFLGRTGEIDDIFVYENLIVLTEYTIKKPGSSHVLGKKVLYDNILKNQSEFLAYCKTAYPDLPKLLNKLYSDKKYVFKIIYVSKHPPSDEVLASCPDLYFMHGPTQKYFQTLANTIEKSATFEFLKFLEIPHNKIGKGAISAVKDQLIYDGFLIPDANSSYPQDYKIVSFYADPERLLKKCYVLRRYSWRDDYHLYQRVLASKKIRQMRKYLANEERVFINNIIVTLPPETKINDPESSGQNLRSQDLEHARRVSIAIPDGFDVIGIVDGQHRVFCYHEGTDSAEEKISELRQKQHLMVTGIVYPKNTPEAERMRFEAGLFLEINTNQTPVKSALTQDIELIIRPYSGIAIAKEIVQRLAKSGPYRDILQTSYFDEPYKIKTSSIVSYGLRPLVKTDGIDSLFFAWKNPGKNNLKHENHPSRDSLRKEYVDFCVDKINDFFIEMKLALPNTVWDAEASDKSPLLSPTAINGMIVCLRKIIESGLPLKRADHKAKIRNLEKLKFENYKSSHWKNLGDEIFDKHYR